MALTSHEILINHPAHLFVGNPGTLNTQVVSTLQELLCPEKGCTYCAICQGIYKHTHYQLLWLEPEGNYTREMIQPILNTLSLQQSIDSNFFIVISNAERLQQSSANALLKSLEEPPQGYHFLLTTSQLQLVLGTIRSRCITHDMDPNGITSSTENQLFAHFTGGSYCNPAAFLSALDQLDFSDQESYDQLDTIIKKTRIQLEEALKTESHKRIQNLRLLIDIYIQASLLPPQSGSSKIFWKNLYLKTDQYLLRT